MKRLLPIFLIALAACSADSSIERGFYHWRQDFDISKDQKEFLNDIGADYLYLKYFDVIWRDEEAIPVSAVQMNSKTKLEVVPVVFITPDVFMNLDSTGCKDLASKVAKKIRDLNEGLSNFEEVQIDCDWTSSIKLKYFYFLEEFKKNFEGSIISCTVRLYQYKYVKQSGVPPVDKGLLMYYNMGDFREYLEPNSILNNEIGSQYLNGSMYPLKLDLALPNFSWALLFRQGEFEQICPNFTQKQLSNEDLFTKYGTNKYVFELDTVMFDTYFRFGDELRYENCSKQDLERAADLLREELNNDKLRILFYDLQAETPNDYEKLDHIFNAFN